MKKNNYHRIPVSMGNIEKGRIILDTMMSIGWEFYGIERSVDKKISEYLFKQKCK